MDLHTHTVASIHAYSTVHENVSEAASKSLTLLGISDHGYGMRHTTVRDYFLNFRVIPDVVSGVRLLKGVEANISNYDGNLEEGDILDRVDYAIASLHPNCILPGSMAQNTQAVIKAIENPQIQILGHPDDGRFKLDYEKVVKAAVANNVAIEVNNKSLSPNSYRLNAKENLRVLLALCEKYDAKVVMSSDAHMCNEVGDMGYAIALLEELDFPERLVINTEMSRLEALLDKRIM